MLPPLHFQVVYHPVCALALAVVTPSPWLPSVYLNLSPASSLGQRGQGGFAACRGCVGWPGSYELFGRNPEMWVCITDPRAALAPPPLSLPAPALPHPRPRTPALFPFGFLSSVCPGPADCPASGRVGSAGPFLSVQPCLGRAGAPGVTLRLAEWAGMCALCVHDGGRVSGSPRRYLMGAFCPAHLKPAGAF